MNENQQEILSSDKNQETIIGTIDDDDKMATSSVGGDNNEEQQDEYFNSYFDCSVHELMIKDKPRTDGYLKSIVENSHVFKDKIVMGE